MFLNRLDYRAPRFVGMGTVRELTILRELEDFLKIAGQLFLFDIKGTKALDTRSINEITTFRQFQHLTEGCGMHSAIMCLADFGGTLLCIRNELVDEG